MDCLLCFDAWKKRDKETVGDCLTQISQETCNSLCDTLGLPRDYSGNLRACDFCDGCKDKAYRVRFVVQQVEQLQRELLSIKEEIFQSLTSSFVRARVTYRDDMRNLTWERRKALVHGMEPTVEYAHVIDEFLKNLELLDEKAGTVIAEPMSVAPIITWYEEADFNPHESYDGQDDIELPPSDVLNDVPKSADDKSRIESTSKVPNDHDAGKKYHELMGKQLRVRLKRLSPTRIQAITQKTAELRRSGRKSVPSKIKTRTCSRCYLSFENEYLLWSHDCNVEEIRDVDENVETLSDSKIDKKHVIDSSERKMGSGNYVCNLCSKAFPKSENLRKHRINVHRATMWECPKCLKKLKIPQPYCKIKHLKICRSAKEERDILGLELEVQKDMEPRESIGTQCNICGKSFSASWNLRKHINNTHRRKETCSELSKSLENKSKLRAQSGDRYQEEGESDAGQVNLCPVCGKTFSTLTKLNKHTTYHQPKLHECTECGKKFFTASHLRRHCQSRHQSYRVYQCERCGTSFKNLGTLQSHISLNCYKANSEDAASSEQLRIRCNVCSKGGFKFFKSLNEHKKQHLDNTIVDSFSSECDSCDLCFQSEREVDIHKSFVHHSEYQCMYCAASYDNIIALRKHRKYEHLSLLLRAENGDWKCSQCNYSHPLLKALNVHCDSHSLGGNLSCFLCPKISRNQIHLSRHLRKVHKFNIKEFNKQLENMKCHTKQRNIMVGEVVEVATSESTQPINDLI